MRCESMATLAFTSTGGCGTEGVLDFSAARRSASPLGRRSRAQRSRARMRARCFRRGAACALGQPGLGDLDLNSFQTTALFDKCQYLDKSFCDTPGSDDYEDEYKCLKLDDGMRRPDVKPHFVEDLKIQDDQRPGRNEEYPNENVEDHLYKTGDAYGKLALPADVGDRDFAPDCDQDFGTEGARHDPVVNSLSSHLNDRDEYPSQRKEEHDRYLVADIEDRYDEIFEDRRCMFYAEGPLDILQFGNSFFSVAVALRVSVASRSCQRWIAGLWVPPQKTWTEVLRRLRTASNASKSCCWATPLMTSELTNRREEA